MDRHYLQIEIDNPTDAERKAIREMMRFNTRITVTEFDKSESGYCTLASYWKDQDAAAAKATGALIDSLVSDGVLVVI